MQSFNQKPPPKPARGLLLTLMLMIATLASLGGLVMSVLIFTAFGRRLDSPDGVTQGKRLLIIMLVTRLAQLGAITGIWMWKRWGLLGYVGMAILQIVIARKLHADLSNVYGHLVWVALVMVVAMTRWAHFDG